MALLSTSDDIGQVLIVTVVYFMVYYAFMVQQLQGKAYRGSRDPASIELDRMCDRYASLSHLLHPDPWNSALMLAMPARHSFPLIVVAILSRGLTLVAGPSSTHSSKWCHLRLQCGCMHYSSMQ